MADQAPAKRHYLVEPPRDDSGAFVAWCYDRDHAQALLADLESVLAAVGGTVVITAQRRQMGEVGPSAPIAATERLIIEWRSHSPLPLLGVDVPAPLPDDLADEPDDPIDDPDLGLMPEELEELVPVGAEG